MACEWQLARACATDEVGLGEAAESELGPFNAAWVVLLASICGVEVIRDPGPSAWDTWQSPELSSL